MRPRAIEGVVVRSVPKHKTFRDRSVPVRSVPCPVCEVAAGEPCAGVVNHHRPRRVMALRAERASADTTPRVDSPTDVV